MVGTGARQLAAAQLSTFRFSAPASRILDPATSPSKSQMLEILWAREVSNPTKAESCLLTGKRAMQTKRAESEPGQERAARQAMGQHPGGDRARSANAAPSAEARRSLDDVDASWLAGEPGALDLAHERYRARLESVAQRIVGNHADAEDVVQKIFIALGGASYRGDSSLWTYLYRSAVNGAVNVLRAKRRRENAERRLLERELIDSTLSPGPDNKVLEGEVMAAVASALLRVKPQHRRVLTLRIMHGLNNTEIAERENLPLPTVGTWLRRGREELRRGLRPLMKELGAGRQ